MLQSKLNYSPITSTERRKRERITCIRQMNIIFSVKENHRIVIENVNDNTCFV